MENRQSEMVHAPAASTSTSRVRPSSPVSQPTFLQYAGNRAIARLLASRAIDAKPAVARFVVEGTARDSPSLIQRKCAECEEHMQRRSAVAQSQISSPDAHPSLDSSAIQVFQPSFQTFHLQPKLAIGAVNDPLEQEADRVADQVMRLPQPELSTGSASPHINRKCSACEEEEKVQKLQTKPAGHAEIATSEAPPIVHEVLRSPGQPLDANTRAFFEPRFGRDFSQVRVHTDPNAAESARAIRAHAYTVGSHIAFSTGHYSPGTASGRQLLAHELTHVVQQTNMQSRGPAKPSVQKTSRNGLMRRVARESTVQICHRVLKSQKFEVSQGGVRVLLMLKPLDKEIPDCRNHKFWVSLSKPGLLFDSDIAECEGETGEDKVSFLFGNIPSGTYYVTIHRVFDHPYCCIEGDILIFDEKIGNDSSGCERRKPLSAMDIVHGALDIAGFIPVLGAIPDGVNAAIYAVEGDWANAGLSAIAMVPAWGDGVKLVEMGGKSVIKISEKAALRMGEEGIAKGLKEVKAASKVEKATLEAEAKAEKAIGKAEKEAAEAEKGIGKAEKETADAAKAEKKEAEEAAKEEKSEKKSEKKKEEQKEGKKKKARKCPEELVSALNAAMHVYCNKPRSCSMQSDTCATATAKVAAGYGCVDGRKKLQQKCFSPGDPGYEGHMRQLAQAYAALRNCQAVMAAKCK